MLAISRIDYPGLQKAVVVGILEFMANVDCAKRIYKLGQVAFTLSDSAHDRQHELSQLLPFAPSSPMNIHEVAQFHDVRSVINAVLALHPHCIWLDAACLLSPKDKVVLISGSSGAGKSTTALALVLGFGWRLLSEDITLIDPERREIIGFASPFSLKEGTAALLEETLGIAPLQVMLGEWLPVVESQIADSRKLPFDLVLHFESAACKLPLSQVSLAPTDYVRLILSCSNLLHSDEAADAFVEYAGSAPVIRRVTAGTLLERLNLILELAKEQPAIRIGD